eukprot:12402285-Karenia_brevis.AAC.1
MLQQVDEAIGQKWAQQFRMVLSEPNPQRRPTMAEVILPSEQLATGLWMWTWQSLRSSQPPRPAPAP